MCQKPKDVTKDQKCDMYINASKLYGLNITISLTYSTADWSTHRAITLQAINDLILPNSYAIRAI